MQLVTAIIQPFMVDRLTRALRMAKVTGYTVDDVQGSSLQPNDPVHLHARVRVEVAVNDDRAEELFDLITATVNTHQKGDGVIYSVPLTRFKHIDSGKLDMNALAPK